MAYPSLLSAFSQASFATAQVYRLIQQGYINVANTLKDKANEIRNYIGDVSPSATVKAYVDAGLPSSDEKAALAGTSGTAPSAANKFVDNADARISRVYVYTGNTTIGGGWLTLGTVTVPNNSMAFVELTYSAESGNGANYYGVRWMSTFTKDGAGVLTQRSTRRTDETESHADHDSWPDPTTNNVAIKATSGAAGANLSWTAIVSVTLVTA